MHKRLQYRTAIRRLRQFQPKATSIRGGTCHCPIKALMLSYIHPDYVSTKNGKEHCGYWCTHCDFANAGSRKILDNEVRRWTIKTMISTKK